MQDWLTNEQNVNPFDANNPMGAMQIANEFQRYWNIHFKNGDDKECENEMSTYENSKDECSEDEYSTGKESEDIKSEKEAE